MERETLTSKIKKKMAGLKKGFMEKSKFFVRDAEMEVDFVKDGEVNPNKQEDGSAATDVSSADKDINGNPNEDKKADTTATAKSYFEDCNHFFK